MIVFNGELSDSAKLHMKKLEANALIIISSIIFVIFSIPTLMLCIYFDWIVSLFFIVFLFPIFGGVLYRVIPTNLQKLRTPTNVSIMRDTLISSGKKYKDGRSIEYVKKVIDYGDWYHIIFYFPHKNVYYLCQKDLISEGTIEEFEELFAEKLVRKKQKRNNGNEEV